MGVHFFNVFKLAKVKIAEPHIPVSAVHPSLAMHISLFCLLQGYQKHQKMESPCRIPEYCKNLEKPKNKKKKQKGRTYVYPKPRKNKKNQKKKQKGQNLCKTKKTTKTKMAEPMSQCLAWGQYFWFFWFFGFSR